MVTKCTRFNIDIHALLLETMATLALVVYCNNYYVPFLFIQFLMPQLLKLL